MNYLFTLLKSSLVFALFLLFSKTMVNFTSIEEQSSFWVITAFWICMVLAYFSVEAFDNYFEYD